MSKKINLVAFNSYGGFSKNGDEYHILNTDTPLPWCNVIANENFGSIISTHGTIYTYFRNSREYKITNWCNDWTHVVPGEVFKGIFEKNYNLVYGFGYVKVTDENDQVEKELNIFIPIEDNVKVQYVTLENTSNEPKEVKISYTLDLALGVSSETDSLYAVTKLENEMLQFKNPYHKEFSDVTNFLKVIEYSGKGEKKLTTQYSEKDTGIKIITVLQPNEKTSFAILLGSFEEINTSHVKVLIQNIIEKYTSLTAVKEEYKKVKEYWINKVKRNIHTGDVYLDIMANGWLLYQAIACRMYAKSAFYQSGGAIGYRDQLQDTMALLSTWPEKTRKQIVLHASKQFKKGDVLHWWHDHTGAGIKTYFSDDYLWLAYVLSEYIEKTNDYSVLDVVTPYLQDKEMGEQRELYDVFLESAETDIVYTHAKQAILYGLSRKNSQNGLLRIGDGDWNDGFSNIRGESVWVTLFMIDILKRFVPIARYKKDETMIALCQNERHQLKNSILEHAWEDTHFVRAFFENGEVLGSFKNEECKIDLISQVWAAIALKDYKDMKNELDICMKSVEKYLIDPKNKIVKLLYPPFDKPKNNPGYIKAYVPGTRENGGQYTHAATWLAKAYFERGEKEKGLEILRYICPIYHADTKELANQYMVEPFVVAADIYSNEEHPGRGGWTWYTGSASWMYKVIEDEFIQEKHKKKRGEIDE